MSEQSRIDGTIHSLLADAEKLAEIFAEEEELSESDIAPAVWEQLDLSVPPETE